MVTANIALDIFGMVLSLIPILYLLDSRRYKEGAYSYLLGIVISNVLMITGDLSDWLIPHPATPFEKTALSVLTVLYYAASACILYFFSRYIAAYMQLQGRTKKRYLGIVSILCVTDIFFVLISPFTGSVFRVTQNGYERGPLFMISQLIPLCCYVLFTALVIICHKKLKRREILFFLLYIFIPLAGNMIQMCLQGIAIVNCGVSIAILFILVNIQFEHELAMRQMEKELAEQRIDIMLTQIQPHFLYNILGTISYLCKNDPEKAGKVTEEFSMFLRGNIDSLGNRGLIPFEKELGHVKNYLYLEQQRFQERLTVVYDIQTTDFLIPPLSLQPLVENAVRHGILQKKEGGTVTLRTGREEGGTVVTIADDGIGMERAKALADAGSHAHIGIENVRTRVRTMVNGTMETDSSDQGTVITIRIPSAGGK